jgi:hypothetical protein
LELATHCSQHLSSRAKGKASRPVRDVACTIPYAAVRPKKTEMPKKIEARPFRAKQADVKRSSSHPQSVHKFVKNSVSISSGPPESKIPVYSGSVRARQKSCETCSRIPRYSPKAVRQAREAPDDHFPDLIFFADPTLNSKSRIKTWVHAVVGVESPANRSQSVPNEDRLFSFQERLCSIIEIVIVSDDGHSVQVFPTKLNNYLHEAEVLVPDDDWIPIHSPPTTVKPITREVAQSDLLCLEFSDLNPPNRSYDVSLDELLQVFGLP